MAASNTVEVRSPRVTVAGETTDSVEYAATVPISSSVDGAPAIRYSTHKSGGDKVESPTTSELIQKIAQAQNAMFAAPTNSVVNIDDGSGNNVSFNGYDTGPHHSILFGGVNNGKSLVHRCARLFFINTTIYSPDDGRQVAEAIKVLDGVSNPCAALKLILEEIIKQFLQSSGEDEGTTSFEVRKKIHETNIKIIEEEWYPILDASTESGIPSFSAASANPAIQMPMYDKIASVYLSGASDFSVIISQFETMFQMRFIPGHMGTTPGKFIPMTALLSDPEDKEVNIISLSMNPGPRKFLTPTAVAIRGLPTTATQAAQAKSPAGYNMITWPETPPAGGQTLVMQMPSWLPADLYPLQITKTGKNLDFDSNFNLMQASQKEIADGSTLVEKICLDIARLTYNDIALEDASATIVAPLDVSWELGKRYTIKQPSTTSGGSSTLFSGFLRRVIHKINSRPSSPEASTQLIFSHVEANGFTLPNK